MVKIMAVYDPDPMYGERFADYVNQRDSTPFTVMAFSSLERLNKYAGEHDVEILLVDESVKELVKDVKAKQLMVLCEGALTCQEDTPSIYKFQSGDCIMREVMASYCNQPMESPLAYLGAKAWVIGVYSPVNRCFKSSLALIMAQILSKKEPVLYMNLEEYSGFSRLISADYQTDLSDVLYLYRQGTYNWLRLKSMVYNWGGMDYIPPVRYAEDLSQVAAEDMAVLIDRIARESGYGKILVDVGQMGRGAPCVLSVCDAVYMPVKEDPVSAAKIEEFEDYLAESGEKDMLGRIQKLTLPRLRSTGQRGEYLESLMWGELGDYVRQLLGGKRPEPM